MTSTSSPRIAFFGATGGCTLAALVRTINAGINCSALARTPSKLVEALKKHDVSSGSIDRHLAIIKGDIRDSDTVKRALVAAPGSSTPETLTDIIVSGIGSYPTLQWSILRPVGLQDPSITKEAMETILKALRDIQSKQSTQTKPLMCTISTTGVSHGSRDVPIAFLGLYHWLLAAPHHDKAAMEKVATEEVQSSRSCLDGVVIVRPSLLMDGLGKDLSQVRVGWEGEGGPGPAVGYTITRDLVGAWIFDSIIKSTDRRQWIGRKVTLTE